MKKKNERNAIPEETKNELKPEVEDGVKLTDEQMAQVTGGAPAPPELEDLNVDSTFKGFDYTDILITRY